jgi:hypothetical protein
VIILPQHESDDLIKTAVDRQKGPDLIAVVNPSHTQALAQMEGDSGHKQDSRTGQDGRPGQNVKAARLHAKS